MVDNEVEEGEWAKGRQRIEPGSWRMDRISAPDTTVKTARDLKEIICEYYTHIQTETDEQRHALPGGSHGSIAGKVPRNSSTPPCWSLLGTRASETGWCPWYYSSHESADLQSRLRPGNVTSCGSWRRLCGANGRWGALLLLLGGAILKAEGLKQRVTRGENVRGGRDAAEWKGVKH